MTDRSRSYYLQNKERLKQKSKIYRDAHKESILAKAKERCTPEYTKDIVLRNKYGISLETYNKMFQEQSGCCAICGRHQSEFKLSLAVDHCHITRKVRSLLCSNCNTGIGNLQDSKEMLLKAIRYLESHEYE